MTDPVLLDDPQSPGDLREDAPAPADREVALTLLYVASKGCRDVRQVTTGAGGTGVASLARSLQIATGWPKARVMAALRALKESGSLEHVAPRTLDNVERSLDNAYRGRRGENVG
jgi:hypothetical protein